MRQEPDALTTIADHETARPNPTRPRTRAVRIVLWGLCAMMAALGLALHGAPADLLGLGRSSGVAPAAEIGQRAPELRLPLAGGGDVDLAQYRGQVVLLNFWATWCAPCREEMPELEQLYREHKSKDGLVVLAVSVDESRAARDIPEFLKEGHPSVGAYTFPVALDEKQEVLKQYKLQGVPQSYFIDAAGVIRVVQPRVMNRQMMIDSLALILPTASSSTAR